jgi:predicted nucleic acid-binding protein
VKFCADSSFIVRLYDPLANASEIRTIRQYLAEGEKKICLSELCRIEVLNVLLRKPEVGALEEFERNLVEGSRFTIEPVVWIDAFQQAESLARRFSATLRPGAHDLVLLAAAVTMGATWFLSFDRNSRQRPLASVAGLRVWPPLDRNEKGLARHASRTA